MTSGELAIARAARRASSSEVRAGHAHGHELGRSLAAAHDADRQRLADPAERVHEERESASLETDPARAVREREDAVVRRALTVHGDRVERLVHHGLQRALQQRRGHRGVGRDEPEHRRHDRLDHAGALRDAPDPERAGRARDFGRDLLGKRIGRHDRARRVRSALARQRAGMRRQSPARPSSCRASRRSRRSTRRGRRSGRSRAPRPSRSAIAAACFRPSGPVQAFAQPLLTTIAEARPADASSWRRETRIGAACARLVVNTAAALAGASDTIEREVEPLLLDAAGDARRAKPLRRGDAGVRPRRSRRHRVPARVRSSFDASSCSRSTFGRRGATLRPP